MLFQANVAHLKDMLFLVRDAAEQIGFAPHDVAQIELAAEEALVNVILHAYNDFKEGEIELECQPFPNGLSIIIRDRGVSFDVRRAKEEQQASDPHEKIGGYGLLLIERLMDQVHYQREGEINVLTLTRYLSQKEEV